MQKISLKKTTLAYLVQGNRVLLAMKKRGFGRGKLNGFGGKVKEKQGESIEQAMVRETKEEIGVKPLNWKKQAILEFYFPEAPQDKDWNQEVYVFLIDEWQGKPYESEEMKPLWLPCQNLPYAKMWADDPFWLPYVLAGKQVRGKFSFDAQGEVLEHKVKVLQK